MRWLLISMGGNDILLGSFDRQEVSASYQQLGASEIRRHILCRLAPQMGVAATSGPG